MQAKHKKWLYAALISAGVAILMILLIWAITPKAQSCAHDYTDFVLSGTPTYTQSVTATRSCQTCDHVETEEVYAAKGLSYETDDDGYTAIVNAGSFRGKVLYLSSKTEDGKTVDGIGPTAFSEAAYAAVFIEEGIHTLGEYAFAFCQDLHRISLPASLATFGDYTFAGCTALRTIEFSKQYTTLGANQFYECTSITSIELPNGITQIPYGTFYGCTNLESVTLPQNLTAIGGDAFIGCAKLKEIAFPETLKEIFPSAFAGCTGLTTLVLPALDTLSHYAFLGCSSLRAVYLPSTIQTIEVTGADGPFFSCSEDLVLYTNAKERPEGWDEHFNNFNSAVADEDGGELDDDAYFNLKVVYNCPIEEFPGK